MRTFFIALNERETDLEYWVEAITSPTKGLNIIRDDLLGICKFAGMSNANMAEAVTAFTGLEVSEETIAQAIMRTFLRGYRLEKLQGYTKEDYSLPQQAHREHTEIKLPYFNTPEFFSQLRDRVISKFDGLLQEHGLDPGHPPDAAT